MSNDFQKKEITKSTEILTRDGAPPQLGVHVMSEFIYCHRAGLLAIEMRKDDTGSEFIPAPALGGIPSHDLDRFAAILERTSRNLRHIALLYLATLLVGFLIIPIAIVSALGMLIGTAVGAFVSGYFWWWSELRTYLYVKRRIREAARAAKREPNWQLNAQQEVNWWELIQSGFDSRELKHSLYHSEINLKGKPWRILRRGDMHLPVLRVRVENMDPANPTQVRLRDQQRARMAAYAYLIETCERGQADWVIVLFDRSDRGIAVPLGSHDWRLFRDGILEARAELKKLDENNRLRPSAPNERRQCMRCPLGRPRPVGKEPTVLLGTKLSAYATSVPDGSREFHSTCGDRFQDLPPHEDAHNLRLTER